MPWLPELNPRLLRHERNAGMSDPPVPRDHLLKPRFRFPESGRDEIIRAVEIDHLLSEALYAGDGYWDSPGDYPSLVSRIANRVLGYTWARVLDEDVYRARATEGLDYLIRTQCTAGDFPCFDHSERGIRRPEDGLFETAAAGRALVAGHRLTGDGRLLEASRAAADWEIACPAVSSVRDNLAAVSHLAAHYQANSDRRALSSAIDRAQAATSTQLPSGGWPGRDSWIWSHGAIVRGLVDLLLALPSGHSFGPELRSSLNAALNRAVRLQSASGEVMPNAHLHVRGHLCAQILDALVAARTLVGGALDDCKRGIMRYRLSKTPDAAFVKNYIAAWDRYAQTRQAALGAATGQPAWSADLDRFVRDVELGEVAAGAFPCYLPDREPEAGEVRWTAVTSERTGGPAQEIALTSGAAGGIGWTIPEGVLPAGRCCRFTASVRCSGEPARLPFVVCSASPAQRRDAWDPITECDFAREEATSEIYSDISIRFAASREAHHVYVWVPEEGPRAMTVDEVLITDAGRQSPVWDPSLDAFDRDPDLALLTAAEYLSR